MTDTAVLAQTGGRPRPVFRGVLPILAVLLVLVLIWYLAAIWMNAPWVRDQAARAESVLTTGDLIRQTLALERPVLPAPHQVALGLWEGIAEQKITSKRSLVWHGWITLGATLAGFAERVIFRELFPRGLTLLDLKDIGTEQLSMSNIAARQELRDLVAELNLPGVAVNF